MPIFFLWNAYFLLKLYLFAGGSIALDLWPNLAFLAFVALPAPAALARRAWFTVLRQGVNAAIAVCLLWHDSYLPPVSQAAAQLGQQGMPSAAYIVSFVLGFFDWPLLAVMLGALMISFALRRWRAVTAGLTGLLLVVAPFYVSWAASSARPAKTAKAAEGPAEPGAALDDFYSREAERVVLFKKPSAPPFDIIIVHVCSMGWADLKAVKLDQHPFFKKLDYLFTGFNTATSYSNPAVMRLLRANCGQTTHSDLYNPVPSTCFLFESLKGDGYQNYVVMSHDGKYGDYTQDIKKNGLADATFMFPKDLPPQSIFFDDSKMFSDFDMLKRWLDARAASNAPRAAVYFNSVNLHAGSHWVDEKQWWKRDAAEQYEDFASFLLHGLDQFTELLEKQSRDTVLVFLPEHGRALKSTPMQGKDLREIPLPGITRVPMGMRFFGPGFKKPAQQLVVDKPISYLALSWLLARMVEKSPFGPAAEAPDELFRKMPTTDFVSTHTETTILEMDGEYLMNQGKSKDWIRLTPNQLGE